MMHEQAPFCANTQNHAICEARAKENFMDTPMLKTLTSDAIERLLGEMEKSAPRMAKHAASWMASLSKTGHAADYFQHPLAFPILLLPCWLEKAVCGEVTQELQANLIYSSVSGYYFIRMIDNVMDEQSPLEIKLLPMTGFFHAQATAVYHQYFDHQSRFWHYFSCWNAQSAELAIEDQVSPDIDLTTFRRIAGKKVVAGKIPMAAVLGHYEKWDHLAAWEHFYDKLSCWHQMFNDVLSWQIDLKHGSSSYFLAEAQRQKYHDETVFAWLVREGFTWSLTILREWLAELLELAEVLDSVDVHDYLRQRWKLLEAQTENFHNSISPMVQLLNLAKPGGEH